MLLHVTLCCCCWMTIAPTQTWCHWSLLRTTTCLPPHITHLPPHITHECQPLDCSLFKPLRMQKCWFYCKNSHQQAKFQKYILKYMVLCLQMLSGIRKTGVNPFNWHTISCVSAHATPNNQRSENAIAIGKSIIVLIIMNHNSGL